MGVYVVDLASDVRSRLSANGWLNTDIHLAFDIGHTPLPAQRYNLLIDAHPEMSDSAGCRIIVVSPTAVRAHQFVERMHPFPPRLSCSSPMTVQVSRPSRPHDKAP